MDRGMYSSIKQHTPLHRREINACHSRPLCTHGHIHFSGVGHGVSHYNTGIEDGHTDCRPGKPHAYRI